jgi:hypothetical protein
MVKAYLHVALPGSGRGVSSSAPAGCHGHRCSYLRTDLHSTSHMGYTHAIWATHICTNRDNIGYGWLRNKIPSLVLKEGSNFLFHDGSPVRISESRPERRCMEHEGNPAWHVSPCGAD